MNGEALFDRIPPQNLEAEMAVLGAILLDGEALVTAMERISNDVRPGLFELQQRGDRFSQL